MTNSVDFPDNRPRPYWSVLIPTFNPDLQLLLESVESVLQAGLSPQDSQIGIVDDGTESVEFDRLLGDLSARGIDVFRFPNGGLAVNWNRCIACARGEWVHILHQDDRVRPGFYEAIRAGANELGVGAAFTQVAFINRSGRQHRLGHLNSDRAVVLQSWIEHVLINLAIQCSAIVVRRAVYERLGGFDETLPYAPDLDMWQRTALNYAIWYDPRPLAEFREHDGSASSRVSLKARWRDRAIVLDRAIAELSPPVRADVSCRGRFYQAQLAASELAHNVPHLRPFEALSAFAAATRITTCRGWLRLAGGRYPAPFPGRAPVRPADFSQPRKPRILLISHFFPDDPERAVFGAFQRLRLHARWMAQIAVVDAVFVRPNRYPHSAGKLAEARAFLRRDWGIEGELAFIEAAPDHATDGKRHPLRAWYWFLRGALSFHDARPDTRPVGKLQGRQMRRHLDHFQPDLIYANRMSSMAVAIRANADLPPVIVDIDDLDHVKILRLARYRESITKRLRSRLWAWLARHVLGRVVRRSALALVCSVEDRQELRAIDSAACAVVLPNVVPPRIPLPQGRAAHALFVGVGAYPPNSDAIRWLAAEIWPRVRRMLPEAKLTVAGVGTEQIAATDARIGLEVLGYVADLEPVYRQSQIVLCPVRAAAGTRLKIIEAAMFGRPTVSTTVGAEGLNFECGKAILIRDDADSFADACYLLLTDSALREKIRMNAYRHAMTHHDAERVGEEFKRLVGDQLNRRQSRAGP